MHHNPILCEFYLQRNLVFFSVYVKSITSVPVGGSGSGLLYEEISASREAKLALLSTPWTKTISEIGWSYWPGSGVYETKTPSLKKKKKKKKKGIIIIVHSNWLLETVWVQIGIFTVEFRKRNLSSIRIVGVYKHNFCLLYLNLLFKELRQWIKY